MRVGVYIVVDLSLRGDVRWREVFGVLALVTREKGFFLFLIIFWKILGDR